MSSLFMKALRREPIERTPVWVMRQAGRYLPEYRQVRAQAGDFLTLCKTPKLATEVTLQPIRRYPLDAAIVFSDILTIPDALGMELDFVEGEGPVFHKPMPSLAQLEACDPNELLHQLDYVAETVSMIRSSLDPELPLLGFSGSPWTLACYMVEGKSSRTYSQLLKQMYMDPDGTLRLVSWLAEMVAAYLIMQIEAGAQALMVFDTWGGLLNPYHYDRFSLKPMQQIVARVKARHPSVPVILFTKGSALHALQLASAGADALGLDWTVDLSWARAHLGHQVALQGNLDPSVLLTHPSVIEREVKRVLDAFGQGSGHVFNLGHGITPEVNPDHLMAMIQAVHRLSPAYHL
jgi:uroporphyrinogen decarboxylase